LHQVATALLASCNCRSNAFAPNPTLFATRALRHLSVENHEANRLLGQVVCGVDARRGDELEKCMVVFAKPPCHVPSLARLWNSLCRLSDNRLSGGGQFAFELIDSLRQFLDYHRLFGDEPFDLPVLGIQADNYRDWSSQRNTTYGVVASLAANF
jgi:hypothetical protein